MLRCLFVVFFCIQSGLFAGTPHDLNYSRKIVAIEKRDNGVPIFDLYLDDEIHSIWLSGYVHESEISEWDIGDQVKISADKNSSKHYILKNISKNLTYLPHRLAEGPFL